MSCHVSSLRATIASPQSAAGTNLPRTAVLCIATRRAHLAADESEPVAAFASTDQVATAAGYSATICGLPRSRYVRAHQTSGTTGSPLLMLDTQEDWQWWLNTWQYVLDVADVSSNEIAFLAFSYGPFIGFWSAHEALVQRGALVVPGGGMSIRLDCTRFTPARRRCCAARQAMRCIWRQSLVSYRSTCGKLKSGRFWSQASLAGRLPKSANASNRPGTPWSSTIAARPRLGRGA